MACPIHNLNEDLNRVVNDDDCSKTNDFQLLSKDCSSYASVNDVYVAKVESLFDNDGEGSQVQSDNGLVLVDTIRKDGMSCQTSRAFYRAGRRTPLYFPVVDGGTTTTTLNAAIVTAGGLCPGLNNVIREVVLTLYNTYNANNVYGIVGGWNGFVNPDYKPIKLTPDIVESIHHEGGSILKTSRGGLDVDKVIEFLTKNHISHLYIVGGDGTHRGAYKIHQECSKRKLKIAVAGIPKTIDNDIDYIDRSFGFYTAIEAAQASIRTALIEAKCTLPNGVGVIKLMGREAGFLAAFAALGSGDVDAVLLPEVPIKLRGDDGILPHIFNRVKEKQYAVVVVAEGAGKNLLGDTGLKEEGSGNDILPPIAEYIRDQIKDYFKEQNEEVRMKYIDPSYNVRAVAANAIDSMYCYQLAHNAVHGCMNGLTGFSTGMVNNRTVYIPIPTLVATSPRCMDPHGPIYDRILAMTKQPVPNDFFKGKGKGIDDNNKGMISSTSFPKLPEPAVH